MLPLTLHIITLLIHSANALTYNLTRTGQVALQTALYLPRLCCHTMTYLTWSGLSVDALSVLGQAKATRDEVKWQ